MSATRTYILVVDDLADAADSLAELLALWGYDAQPLYDGAAALGAARPRRPAAVLLDLGMPGMDGFQFAIGLRELPGCCATLIVAVTGHHRLEDRAREVGIEHYLVKPIDLIRLRELLESDCAPKPARVGRRHPRKKRRTEWYTTRWVDPEREESGGSSQTSN